MHGWLSLLEGYLGAMAGAAGVATGMGCGAGAGVSLADAGAGVLAFMASGAG